MTAQATAAQTVAPVQPTPVTTGAVLQRACVCGNHAAGGECEGCKKKREAQGGMLQRHPAPSPPGGAGEVPPIVHEVLRSPGQPLDTATRAFMEPRFGHDFSGVRAHTDPRAAESAQTVNALAYTVGHDVVFGAGQYAPSTTSGRSLIAHELTHVVQQGGVGVPPTRIGPVDDMFEYEANRMSYGLSSFHQTTIRSMSAPHALQRYQIQGPWNKNDPVHETITEEALRKAGLLKPGQKYTDPDIWEYIRGVIWNDDPEGQLFDSNKRRTDDFSSGISWYSKFRGAEKKAAKGGWFGPKDDLMPRSHFGDLQFIHGMASADKEQAVVTQGKIMLWGEFAYKVAIGEISEASKIGSVSISGIPELFPRLRDETVARLFGVSGLGDVKKRAAGSLLHMIQDSYASGHVQRENLASGSKGKIISFHSYANQDHKKHGHDDAFRGKGSRAEKLKNVPGALDAVDRSAQVLKFIAERKSWEDVKLYLEMEVFSLVRNPLDSGAGNEYLKKRAPREPEYMSPGVPSDAGDFSSFEIERIEA